MIYRKFDGRTALEPKKISAVNFGRNVPYEVSYLGGFKIYQLMIFNDFSKTNVKIEDANHVMNHITPILWILL